MRRGLLIGFGMLVTRLNPEATLLVIESWTPPRGLRLLERE
jgi:hypothetical protein